MGAIWSFGGPFWASSFYKRSVTRAHAQRAQIRPQLRRSRQQGRMGPLPPLPRLLVGTVPSGSNESIDSALWTRSYGFRHHKSLCNTSAARKKCVNSQADTTRRGRAWPCTVSDCCVATHDVVHSTFVKFVSPPCRVPVYKNLYIAIPAKPPKRKYIPFNKEICHYRYGM